MAAWERSPPGKYNSCLVSQLPSCSFTAHTISHQSIPLCAYRQLPFTLRRHAQPTSNHKAPLLAITTKPLIPPLGLVIMSSRRPSNLRPVVVEVRPDYVASSIAPSSPSSATTKSVRFAPTSENESSRPLTTIEAWSLYNFETHARQCSKCSKISRLCDVGSGLAQDVACHVFSRDSDIWSVLKDKKSNNFVRVEVPHGYTQLRKLLRSTERGLRTHKMSVPTPIDYTRVYPVSSRRISSDKDVYIESASTARVPRSRRYSIRDDDLSIDPAPFTPRERRGTLYHLDAQRRNDRVLVEVREPDVLPLRQRRHSVYV